MAVLGVVISLHDTNTNHRLNVLNAKLKGQRILIASKIAGPEELVDIALHQLQVAGFESIEWGAPYTVLDATGNLTMNGTSMLHRRPWSYKLLNFELKHTQSCPSNVPPSPSFRVSIMVEISEPVER